MKKIFVLIISLFCINTIYAQTASYNSVRKNKLSGAIETYITKFGKTIRVNDQITIGKAYNFETYAIIFWGEEEASVIKISSFTGCDGQDATKNCIVSGLNLARIRQTLFIEQR